MPDGSILISDDRGNRLTATGSRSGYGSTQSPGDVHLQAASGQQQAVIALNEPMKGMGEGGETRMGQQGPGRGHALRRRRSPVCAHREWRSGVPRIDGARCGNGTSSRSSVAAVVVDQRVPARRRTARRRVAGRSVRHGEAGQDDRETVWTPRSSAISRLSSVIVALMCRVCAPI